MKKTFTLLSALCGVYLLQAQCASTVVVATTKDTLTSGGVTVINHATLWYDAQGKPVRRKNVDPATSTTYFDDYYYNGSRLDSIIGFADEALTARNGVYRKYSYDANGKLVKEVKKLPNKAEDITNFTYTNNVLSSVSSADFTVSAVTFAGGNLNSASAVIPPIPDPITGTFTSDANINPFSGKLGISDDYLAYFNTNNILTFGVGNFNALTLNYRFDANNRPTWLKRTEALMSSAVLSSAIGYSCLDDVLLGINDAKITITNNVSPNPSMDGVFTINEPIESVTVRNLEGAVLLSTTDSKVDLSSQKAGMYLLQIQTSTGLKMAKVVKE